MVVVVEVFQERLDLLEQSGQLSRQARTITNEIVAALDAQFGPLTEDNAGPLVSHLALSLERLRDGVVLESDPLVLAEAAEYGSSLSVARELTQPAARLGGGHLPDSEVAFLAIHIRALEQTRDES